MASEEVGMELIRHRQDYADSQGRPFEYFFCPLLLADEDVELCRGHVIPQSFPNCSRASVVQRKDVDGFYGTVAEAEFSVLLRAREKGLRGVLGDQSLQRILRPRVMMGEEEVKHYVFRGHQHPAHSRVSLECDPSGEVFQLVFAKTPEEVIRAQNRNWGIIAEHDFRLSALMTLVKAAYLTMFHLHGYRWALSAGGVSVGYDVLGRFFREHRGKESPDIRREGVSFFSPYVHMCRPVVVPADELPMRGTIEDNKAGICFGSSGRPFGLVVYVRIDQELHAILMPGFNHPDSAAAYWEFLKNDNEILRISDAQFDSVKKQWLVSPEPVVRRWPKSGDSFDLA